MKFALFFGNRGFFPEKLIASARDEMKKAVESAGHEAILADAGLTRYGAVETAAEGRIYADFLKANSFDGVILSLPNFGDETGAIAALQDCGTPILIQAYPDEIGKMDFEQRRDAFCGKFSIMDVFYQYNLPFTTFEPHVVHPLSEEFSVQLDNFAAVCRVFHGMKRFTLGAIGARTTPFKTVRFDELALQRGGITTETLDLSAFFAEINSLADDDDRVIEKKNRLYNYTDCTKAPGEKLLILAKAGVVLDNIIEEYRLDALALRCWNEFETQLGISPCVLLSELNDRGITAACELDAANAVAMRALSLASEQAATCLDWNNNYGDAADKCILFHCGPVPASLMAAGSGVLTEHPMFAKAYGAGCGWGCNQGRIAENDMTFLSAKTENGRIVFYSGQGRFTGEEIEKGFFGCAGVAEIPELQRKLRLIGRQGFRHHVGVTTGHVEAAVRETFTSYLDYDLIQW